MKRILVADDDREVVESLRNELTPYCRVDTATTGLEVLQLFAQRAYSGLIIDVHFEKGVSGLDIATMLRAKHKELKILVFSATDYSDAVRQKVVDIGGSFSEKPLELEFVRKVMGF